MTKPAPGSAFPLPHSLRRHARLPRTRPPDHQTTRPSNHLGSTSLATTATGGEVGRQWYYPYGDQRHATGSLPTDYRFTGQRIESTIGLYDYGARFYDPLLGRFVSADSVVPEPGNPQALNRFSYVLNNPLRYVDPTGHQGNNPNEGPPDPPIPLPDPNDPLAVWVYQALLMVWQQGGAIGREWVQRWVDNPPDVRVYDLDGIIGSLPGGDIKGQLEYMRTLGSGHFWGVIPVAAHWLDEEPTAWKSSVLIHEFVHCEQYRAAGGGSGSGSYDGGIGLGITMRIYQNILAGAPSLEKERGAHYVQWQIRYNMTDDEVKRKELAADIAKLEKGGADAYAWLQRPGSNNHYRGWPVSIKSPVDTTRFPLSY